MTIQFYFHDIPKKITNSFIKIIEQNIKDKYEPFYKYVKASCTDDKYNMLSDNDVVEITVLACDNLSTDEIEKMRQTIFTDAKIKLNF